MKLFNGLGLSFIPLFFLTTCHFSNFYPDADNPGLSRFTARGYNVASTYINDSPLVNVASYYPLLYKDSTGTPVDTLQFTWALYSSDLVSINSAYTSISFSLPVPQLFNKKDFLGFSGRRFLNSIVVTLQDSSMQTVSGSASLYFVSVSEALADPNQKYLRLSGLFDGNIGDSVFITKGRFDFEIDEGQLNF